MVIFMTLNTDENFLREIIVRLEFHSVPKLLGENGDDSNFENIIKSEFPNINTHEQNFAEFDLNDEATIKNQGKNKIWVYEKENIKKLHLEHSSVTLSYNGELFNNPNGLFNDIDLIINALKELSVENITLIALRYINEITPKSKIENWDKWINPELHNFKFEPQNSKIIRSMNRADYRIDEYNLIFQYGQFNLNYPSTVVKDDFVLDYECSYNNIESINDVKDHVLNMDKIIHKFYNESVGELLDNGG